MRSLIVCSLVAASAALLPASIIVSVEAPGVQSTTTPGVVTQDFNSFAAGPFAGGATNVGTYSVGGQIVNPDAFGGSNATKYISVGAQSGTTSYSLTFNGLQSYFGFYWPAIDALNSVTFYNGATLLATFTSANIESALVNPNAYLGNPNNGQDRNEHFVYVNFNADLASRFDKIVFHDTNTSTGFETDNHSIAGASGVPEPNAYFLTGLGLAGLILLSRAKRTKATYVA